MTIQLPAVGTARLTVIFQLMRTAFERLSDMLAQFRATRAFRDVTDGARPAFHLGTTTHLGGSADRRSA
jgi:hypothetical protein